jgi:Restriction Enzyme Adenine Methylase Associated
MPIDNRELSPGTRLVASYKGKTHICQVVSTPEGVTRFQLEDGRMFNSPSSAGKAVMNGISCNGWRFWSLAGEAGAAIVSPARPSNAKATPKPKGVKRVQQIKRLRIQKEAPEGQTHWFCSACQKGFFRPTGEEPATCNEGHPGMVDDELAC